MSKILKRTVILSTNDNPDYYKYLPFVQKAWNKLGWETLTFSFGEYEYKNPNPELNKIIDVTNRLNKYKVATIVQVSRLLAGHYVDEGLIMTGDVDMMPLSDYWKPKIDEITVYGYDLTGRSEYPICYISMNSTIWREIIPEKTINELLKSYPNALSDEFYTWWGVDQQIMTERLKGKVNTFVDRGLSRSGLAKGRIDRADWAGSYHSPDKKIDAHLLRPFNQIITDKLLKEFLDE